MLRVMAHDRDGVGALERRHERWLVEDPSVPFPRLEPDLGGVAQGRQDEIRELFAILPSFLDDMVEERSRQHDVVDPGLRRHRAENRSRRSLEVRSAPGCSGVRRIRRRDLSALADEEKDSGGIHLATAARPEGQDGRELAVS